MAVTSKAPSAGLQVSVKFTPQAQDDYLHYSEDGGDAAGYTNDASQMLSNDGGGNAAMVWGIYAQSETYVQANLATLMAAQGNQPMSATSFSLGGGSVSYANGDISFNFNTANTQYLAAGESVDLGSFTYIIRMSNGAFSTATAHIVIDGSNDAVSITSGPQTATVVEDADTTPSLTDSMTAAGTIAFTDPDLSDTHTAVSAANVANTTHLGTFSLDPVSEAANAAAGAVQWHYALDNAAAQSLAEGQTVIEHYTVTISDGHGSTATQDVAITIAGTNDVVSITSGTQAGTVVEDADTTPSLTDSMTADGTIAFTDPDLSDTHTAGFAANAANNTHLGTFSLDPVSEAANAANGSVQWHYSLDNAAAQSLAEGQTVIEHYTVTISDGHGSSVDQDVAITIAGTNDAVSITSGTQAGTVVEDADTTPSLTDSMTADGTIAFADPDLSDTHTAGFAANAANTSHLGTFSLDPVGEAANAANGSVQWHYSLDDAAAQSLAQDESVTEHYTVTISDGHGSSVDQDVQITITGTNDLATISGDHTATFTEDVGPFSASGVLTVSDVDHGENVFGAVDPADLNGTYGTFAFNENSGAWTYTLNNAGAAVQALNTGDVRTDTLTVHSLDGTDSEDIVVTINGANEAASTVHHDGSTNFNFSFDAAQDGVGDADAHGTVQLAALPGGFNFSGTIDLTVKGDIDANNEHVFVQFENGVQVNASGVGGGGAGEPDSVTSGNFQVTFSSADATLDVAYHTSDQVDGIVQIVGVATYHYDTLV